MRLLGNIIYFFCGGFVNALVGYGCGLLLYITIIGIPFARQLFKFGRLSLAPFGKKVDLDYGAHPIANTIWLILVGWSTFLSTFLAGVSLCITIIGIPFGLQAFKFAFLGLAPFGAEVSKA